MYQQVKLDEVCVRKIETISSDENGLIDYFDIASVDNTKKKIISHQSLKVKEAPSRAKQIVQLNDILVSTVRPNLNAIAMIDNKTKNKMVASTGFCVLRASEKIEPRYLFYFVQSPTFINSMTAQATGASYPAVSNSIVKSSHIPLPDLPTQRRIADTLDKVSEGIGLCGRMMDELDLMVKAKFGEMFGDPTGNSFNLSVKPMTEVCEIIDGDRGKNYPNADEFSDEGYCLFLNAKNVTASGFNFDNCMYITKEKDDILRKGKLSRGDVVLTTRGTIGNLAFYTSDIPYEHVRINSGMVILRMNQKIINEVFFIEQFKMLLDDIKQKIASGSAQPQLPISAMREINLLLPDIEQQKIFSEFVAKSNKSRLTLQQVLSKIELKQKVLMQKYFG